MRLALRFLAMALMSVMALMIYCWIQLGMAVQHIRRADSFNLQPQTGKYRGFL
jgi:hypothetical protein